MGMRVLVTGGTLDGFDYTRERDAPQRKTSKVPSLLRQARISTGYAITTLFLKDSRFITSEDLEEVASACRKCKEGRILITHGSFTMAATAKFLAAKRLGKTIVVTGAITPVANHASDSKFNIGFAFAAAQLLPKGVYVAMNGRIFRASNVRKNLLTGYFENER